jgi:type IV pilus biogenesis protein PilP
MQAISRIAVCAVLISNCAFAETPLPKAAGGQPIAIAPPPGPPDLVPLAQDFQAAMANSQLQTYRYNQLTEQALALKKLCDTGFGPSEICGRRESDAAAGMSGSAELPTVSQIDGPGGSLSAVLVFADGRHLTVHPGTALPGGLTVAAISNDDVRLRSSSGGETVLAFGDRGPSK